MDREDYILSHVDGEGAYLHALWRDTQLRLPYGQMASGHLQGRLLKMLTRLARPERVLEIGTFSGYSALCMAEGLPPGGSVDTFEVFDEQEYFSRPWIEGSPWAGSVRLHLGDALELVPGMGVLWDMVFIDADKRRYPDYYRMVRPRTRPGGLIVADNTLWYGRVLDGAPRASDAQTRGVMEFNDLVAADTGVEKVILPLRDGLTLVRVKDA